MFRLPATLRRLARYAFKPVLQRLHSRFTDPIRLYSIDGMYLFAHENEVITRTFASYKARPDSEKYNDFFFVRALHEQWGACNLVDIGVNYGQDLLLQAGYKQKQGIPGQIIGFEPNSRVFGLLPHTFRQNGIQATFHHLALGERSGSIILEGRKHNSQGMTTIGLSFPNLYEVVEVRTLDETLAHLLDRPCFVKLDTQGAEWLIWKGGTAFAHKPDIVVRTEFTPGGTKGISGPDLLAHYFQLYVVIDAKTNARVDESGGPHFCSTVAADYHYGYTDLYLIPKSSPLVAKL